MFFQDPNWTGIDLVTTFPGTRLDGLDCCRLYQYAPIQKHWIRLLAISNKIKDTLNSVFQVQSRIDIHMFCYERGLWFSTLNRMEPFRPRTFGVSNIVLFDLNGEGVLTPIHSDKTMIETGNAYYQPVV